MAINNIVKATIQMRKGLEADFDADQMTAGEWAVSTDKRYVRMCFAAGICLRMATYEAFEEDMKKIQLILATCEDIQTAIEAFASLAEQHELQAELYSIESKSWAVGGTGSRQGEDIDNSKYYSQQAKLSAENAAVSEANSATSATTSMQKALAAAQSEINAANSASAAASSEEISASNATKAANSAADAASSSGTAASRASEAYNSAIAAAENAENIENNVLLAQSYVIGGTGTRENEDVDNSKYYYEQAKRISQGMNGLIPMGTITFADLGNPDNQVSKYMFNISDAFTTDATFKEGAGHYYGAGTNVYRTDDGYWDALAGSTVTGIKGEKETTYRQGNVNITPDDIGALATNGDSKDNTVSFTTNDMLEPAEWREMGLLTPIEPHATIFTKISTAFRNLRYLYKLLGTTDISAIGDGTVSGAIHAINDKLFIKFCNGTDVNTVLETQFQSMAAKSQQSIWVRSNIKNMVGVMYRYDATGFALLSYQNETTTHAYARNADGTWTGETLATQAQIT